MTPIDYPSHGDTVQLATSPRAWYRVQDIDRTQRTYALPVAQSATKTALMDALADMVHVMFRKYGRDERV